MVNADFNNTLTLFVKKTNDSKALNKLGFVDDSGGFCTSFMLYMFIHFKRLYYNIYIENEIKQNIDNIYNYIINRKL